MIVYGKTTATQRQGRIGEGWKTARPAADRDERIEKFREGKREAKARRVDWVTEIIRTMIGRDDARLVERFFLTGRLPDTIVGFVFAGAKR